MLGDSHKRRRKSEPHVPVLVRTCTSTIEAHPLPQKAHSPGRPLQFSLLLSEREHGSSMVLVLAFSLSNNIGYDDYTGGSGQNRHTLPPSPARRCYGEPFAAAPELHIAIGTMLSSMLGGGAFLKSINPSLDLHTP